MYDTNTSNCLKCFQFIPENIPNSADAAPACLLNAFTIHKNLKS